MRFVLVLSVFILPLAAQRKPGSQLDHLPPNLEVLTHFGKGADISPDNRHVAFMPKSLPTPAGVGYGIVLYWCAN